MTRRVTNDIRKLRFEANEITQGALAEKVGVTRQTINAIERGKWVPSLDVAFLIAEALGVDLSDVFALENP